MTLLDLQRQRPACLTDKNIENVDEIAFYVKRAESYMSFLDGMVMGMQEAVAMFHKEEA